MSLAMLKTPPSFFQAYGEAHGSNLSVCIAAHADHIDAGPEFRHEVAQLTQIAAPAVAEFLLEEVAGEFAKWLVIQINRNDTDDILTGILRRLLALSATRFCIDVLTTDELMARKTAGHRNRRDLNTRDPSEPEIC